jgi:hypothetical protein
MSRGYHKHGEQHHGTKLTDAKVLDIRAQYKMGASYRQLAAKFGVGRTTVAQIVTYKIWTHLSP